MDRSAVGRRGARFRFPVEAGKVHELARAASSTQAAYLADDPVVPPTFLKLSQFTWEPAGRSAVDLIGFDPDDPPLHAEQEFEFFGPPPRAGTLLHGQTLVASIEDRPSRTYGRVTAVVIATEYHDGGRLVAVARSTSVQRPPRGAQWQAPCAPAGGPATSGREPGAVKGADDRTTGAASPDGVPPGAAPVPNEPPPPAPRVVGPLTLTDLVRYQGAAGDMNPSHHDEAYARRNGSPGVFAPGLLSAALLADWATSWLGPERVRRFGVRFRTQVLLGDVLTCDGSASSRRPGNGGTEVDLSLQARRGDGTVVTAGWATFATAP